jgi:predicted Fe-Mo cluster-binding NifX family protein
MKVAIPVFHTKISPRFDSTQGFLLLQIEKSDVIKRENLPTKNWPSSAKIKELVDLEIDTLICGGIDLESMQQLNFNGIKIYSWITGEIEDAVTRFLNQGLESGIILGPRGQRKGRWRFCEMRNHSCNMYRTGVDPKRKGVKIMPKKNGTGPKGQGAGKGPGCTGSGRNKKGCGRAKGRGVGQGSARGTGRRMAELEKANDYNIAGRPGSNIPDSPQGWVGK